MNTQSTYWQETDERKLEKIVTNNGKIITIIVIYGINYNSIVVENYDLFETVRKILKKT